MVEDRLATPSTPRLQWALGPSAPQRCSDELLGWVADLARRHGLQVFTHVYEAKSQAVLARLDYPNQSLIEHLDRFGLLGSHLTIAHGVWIDRKEIRRLGAAGANLACNPTSNMKLLNGFAPIADYAEAGVGIALGCDNCSGNDAQNMFESMKLFALFWGMYGKAGDGGAARAAFAAATVGGARALGKASELGRLRPGFRADAVLIDLDSPNYCPVNSAVRQLVYGESGRGVHTVIVDGRVVVEKRELVTISQARLTADAEAARERLTPEVAAAKDRTSILLDHLLAAHDRANAYPLGFDRFLVRRQ
jgi:5-methylthioadenosine/S-adenosylhomocysteine deaminase